MKAESKWTLLPNGKGLYILTLNGSEGTDKLWLDEEELLKLRMYLNTVPLPFPENELPL